MNPNKKNVKVVVLGDIGRSPRMQYHCMSLSEMGHQVDVIGYGETDPIEPIKRDPLIFYHYMFPVPQIPIKLVSYAFKTVWQALNLLFLLFITTKSDIVLMQNPPTIPCMVVCWFYAKIVSARFVIDWHNYAYSIMGLSLGDKHLLVKITKKVETSFGRKADFNFCVTRAMKEDLNERYGISATTLYDRPPEIFHPISSEDRHKFLEKCSHKYDTSFRKTLGPQRAGFLISSTSWTEDEDFSTLLTALQDYEEHCKRGNARNLPNLICAITGKGPLKPYYLQKISKLNWTFVTVITPWLDSDDYPLLLASADLGVSLHTSSSSFDLPMKVVDMFGCGLPVCALNFNCLNELVKDRENSFVFSTAEELLQLILDWFENFPVNDGQKELEGRFKTELQAFQTFRWRENWKLVAENVFK